MKAGDGTTAWTSLSYINVVNSTNAAIADESKTADKLTNGLVVKDTTGKTVTFDGSSSVDLSGGIYYAVSAGTANNALAATTADTANKTKNAITFKNKSNAAVSFDGTTAVDLSNGIYYAETANTAATATTATTTTSTTNDDAGNKISTSYFKIDGSNAMSGPLVLNASSNSFLYAGDKFNFAGNSLATGNVYFNYTSANVIKDYMLCNGDNAGTLAEVKMSNFVGNWNGHAWDEISTTYATKADMDAKIGDIETALKTIQGGSTDKTAAGIIQRDVTSVDIPSGTTKIGNYAFYYMTNLASVTIPNSVTSIGDYAFQNCSGLASAAISNSVTSIGNYSFQNCSSLASATIPNSVVSIGNNSFQNCSNLASVTIPNSVTSIGDYAFQNCSSLTSITISSLITSIGNCTFNGCTNLASITIPNSVTSIGYNAFFRCTSLASITIPSSVTSIGNAAFDGCTNLTSIVIPSSVTSIGIFVFKNCTNLKSITIPSSVTAIGSNTFYGCTALTSITINKASGSITGSPWGATNATVTWTG